MKHCATSLRQQSYLFDYGLQYCADCRSKWNGSIVFSFRSGFFYVSEWC